MIAVRMLVVVGIILLLCNCAEVDETSRSSQPVEVVDSTGIDPEATDEASEPTTPEQNGGQTNSSTLNKEPKDKRVRGAGQPNFLVHEPSPYLQQHAGDPVDWYPWSREAFEAARDQDKPIMLSVGYSSCYWCNIMQRESFLNETIADLLNQHFICIKVDREERADVDALYQAATEVFTQRTYGIADGGWPLTVFIEPQSLKPFMCGTYFSLVQEHDSPAFSAVIQGVAASWKQRRADMERDAAIIGIEVSRLNSPVARPVLLKRDHVELSMDSLLYQYDPEYAGFGHSTAGYAPKFFNVTNLLFLAGVREEREACLAAMLYTLDAMAVGGVFDQIGGGFHRYSTDRKWLIPHFEKLLCDQGLLALAYAQGHQLTADPLYERVLRLTLEYVLRELKDDAGGFYSAQCAETDTREGHVYLWTSAMVREALIERGFGSQVEFALNAFGLAYGTNFVGSYHDQESPANVLFIPRRIERLAAEFGMTQQELLDRLKMVGDILLDARRQRPQPPVDRKVIAGWNGLMIAGLVEGGTALRDRRYLDAARRAAAFLVDTMRGQDGLLRRYSVQGKTHGDGLLEDYAFVIYGLLRLYAATGELHWLNAAEELAARARSRYWDPYHGGYYDTPADQPDLFIRLKSIFDGQVPGANSTMLHNLFELHHITGKQSYLDDLDWTFYYMSLSMAQSSGTPKLAVLTLDRYLKQHGQSPAHDERFRTENYPRSSVAEVEVQLSHREVVLEVGVPQTISVWLRMKSGCAVVAAEPMVSDVTPFRVAITGSEGIRSKIDYPKGSPMFKLPGKDGMQQYTGGLILPVELIAQSEFEGHIVVRVTLQVCTAGEVRNAQTEELKLDIRAVK